MRHLNKPYLKIGGRTHTHRKAMLANMASSLIMSERIQTTDTKAKALRSFVERLITLGKRGDLHARRIALSRLRNPDAIHKLFADIGPRMQARQGGYTRILKLSNRRGDNAPISIIEFVDVDFAKLLKMHGATDDQIAALNYNPSLYVDTAIPAADSAAPSEPAAAAEAPATDNPEGQANA